MSDLISNGLTRFKMDISYPSADKPAFIRHIATTSGEWVRFVDADKRIEELEARLNKVREAFDYANYRFQEWGERAETVGEMIEQALKEDEDEG